MKNITIPMTSDRFYLTLLIFCSIGSIILIVIGKPYYDIYWNDVFQSIPYDPSVIMPPASLYAIGSVGLLGCSIAWIYIAYTSGVFPKISFKSDNISQKESTK